MFLGSYRHSVDSKGRVAVPAQFRRGLPPGSVLSRGPEGRLVIRDPEGWAALGRDIRLTAVSPADERRLYRAMWSSAREVELDAQGRVLLPEEHRTWAGIADSVVFVGLGESVEIVSATSWDEEQADLDADAFTALNDRVLARGVAPSSPEPA